MAFCACSQRLFFALQNEPKREKTIPKYLDSFTFSKTILLNKNLGQLMKRAPEH